ncbi:MAG: AI-2E family transporter [Firmicutes bacterium]|nr:AI-2E family transporter [Bacillota bacterium]
MITLFRKKDDNVDYKKLNEGISIGVTLLRIVLVLVVALFIYICSRILADWQILSLFKRIFSILSPLFIGLLIAWLFDPFIKKLQKKGVNRTLGTIFVYVIFLSIIYLVLKIMIPTVSSQINDLVASVPAFLNSSKEWIDGLFDSLSKMTGYDLQEAQTNIYDSINNLGNSLTVGLPQTIMNLLSNTISGGANLLIGLLAGFYMSLDFGNVKQHLITSIPKRYRGDTRELLSRLNDNLRSYVQGTLKIMLILFIFQSIALGIAGLKAPMIFGLFCAVTNVIPYIGPYIGGAPAVIVGLSMSPMTGICVLIAVIIAQVLESNFLQPVVMGKTMKLHPVTIMIGLLFFGNFFGILGMIFATPIIAFIKTIWQFFNEKFEIMEKMTNQ